MIVFASIMGTILATGLLALNPSLITNASAQVYQDRYGYDKQPEKTNVNVQKIKCVNSNINVNGVDITQVPQGSTALASTNEAGTEDASNAQNGNGPAGINSDRNLINVCSNINLNEQVRQVNTGEGDVGGDVAIACPIGTDLQGVLVTDEASCNININLPPLFECSEGSNLGVGAKVTDPGLCNAATPAEQCPAGTQLKNVWVTNATEANCSGDGEQEPEPTATLSVNKTIACIPFASGNPVEACNRITTEIFPNGFNFHVTGENPNPDSFLGSAMFVPTIVTLSPGNYVLQEGIESSTLSTLGDIQNSLNVIIFVSPLFSGNCTVDSNDMTRATGTIVSGELQTCDVTNLFQVTNQPPPL
jgi:hypothetical protein